MIYDNRSICVYHLRGGGVVVAVVVVVVVAANNSNTYENGCKNNTCKNEQETRFGMNIITAGHRDEY